MSKRELDGTERESLVDALTRAFSSTRALDRMVKHQFNPVSGTNLRVRNLAAAAATNANLPAQADELLDFFADRDMVDQLVLGARRENPDNEWLKDFAADYFASSVQRQITNGALERKVLPLSDFEDPAVWREQLEVAEGRVCRIKTPTVVGSGFLVGRDVVLTNYHVLADLYAHRDDAAAVQVQFDVKNVPGRGLVAGPVFGLHGEWDLASSPPSRWDSVPCPRDGEPTRAELDFALVRLAGPAADEDVGDGRPRGSFALSEEPVALAPNAPVIILQYPNGGPLKLAWTSESFLEVNALQTRTRYRTRTEGGSSGSPCFDASWRVFALHHSGDPDFYRRAEYNEGIPVATILAALPPSSRAAIQ